jgi:four helix bundle protein
MLNVELEVSMTTSRRHDIQERTFQFAYRIVQLHGYLTRKSGAARVIARQVLRSGTSIGANMEEANSAQSKADFNSKCAIAAKEARETRYWLRLLAACTSIKPEHIASLTKEASEIVAILATIVKNAETSPHRG